MTGPPLPPPDGQMLAMRAGMVAAVSGAARAAAFQSLELFARYYLAGTFSDAPSPMHRELFALLEKGTVERGMRFAVAAPRRHAKSAIISLAYVLWCIVTGREKFIVLISATADQACEQLGHVKRELEGNERLARDFPDAAGSPKPHPWRKDEVVTRNGVRLKALGAGNPVRGRRHGSARPGLIILDDVENEADVRSEDKRRKNAEWFRSGVGQAGTDTTNVIVAGTLLHPDCLLATLLDPARGAGWTGRLYKAVTAWATASDLWASWEEIYRGQAEHEGRAGPEAARAYFEAHRAPMLEGAAVLWERESYYELMKIRLRDGAHAFSTEKQNEPYSPEDALFREQDLHFWDERFSSVEELLETIGGECQAYGACDPSLGKHGRGRDDTAIVVVLRHTRTGVNYVVVADIRRRTPSETIEAIIAYHKRFNFVTFGFEVTQFQQVMSDLLVERSRAARCEVPVREIHHTTDKISRMQRMQPRIASGGIQLTHLHQRLLDQLRQFPRGAHDDGPDALEMAVEVGNWPLAYYDVYDGNSWTRKVFD